MTNLSISYQNINRVDEGITTTDVIGLVAKSACNLQCPIWIKKRAIKKVDSLYDQEPKSVIASMTRRPTDSD